VLVKANCPEIPDRCELRSETLGDVLVTANSPEFTDNPPAKKTDYIATCNSPCTNLSVTCQLLGRHFAAVVDTATQVTVLGTIFTNC
jgi:hypothetical protein